MLEDNSLPLVTVEIAVRNGSFTESPDYNGLSHLYEHMFFKANKDIPSQEKYLDRMHELGMSFNGTTNTGLLTGLILVKKIKLPKKILNNLPLEKKNFLYRI
ncbi:MAG TPA: insulinase family protein [Chitinophagaceae bacterium]|nr:insulinase family protein [Chitinophagaceae bacterium]